MIFTHIENGKVKGFFNKEIHGDKIPKNSIQITEYEWQHALEINANTYENGRFVVKDFRTLDEKTADLADTARAERDRLIESVRWRIERHKDELALGSEPTEPLEPLLQYTQALRDVPKQEGFPTAYEMPKTPEWL